MAHLAGSSAFGGGERYLELLCDRMDPQRYRSLLICPEPGPFVDRMSRRGIPTHVIHLKPLVNPVALGRLTCLLRREGVSILQTHGARSNAYGQVAGRLAGVPVVISTVHNSIRDYEVPAWKQRVYLAVLRRTSRWADRIICVSEALRRHVVAEMGVPSSRAVVVYNGVDPAMKATPDGPAAVRREFGVEEAPLLIAIGRLTPQKGHRHLLDALPGLVQQWPRLRCVIIGEGELSGELRAHARQLGLEQHVQFAGVRQDIP
ncbi:MAG: glycosyltransferase, partial [Nitrospirales bacterium]